ncbi:hypothetical protein SEMRO_594_G172430.1 [Seminavis robusta]|uniref:Uncharacterized protein n=1 Tax=Seminavis robusta TaxID=568900 RepID=A0A9N8E694_9STRA|nr:hypothetical protein SEMRO_594_G172430.1 [Seminavis robusta]|eukprot:Sro594_g172430.1 n/a (138) ;mRNA; r:17706-18119
MDQKNMKQFPAASREGEVSKEEGEQVDRAFLMNLDLVVGSEDLALSKLISDRLGEIKEIPHQNEHDMKMPSLTPTRKAAVYASTNGPLEDPSKPTKQAHNQFLLVDAKIEASNPSCMANSSGTNNGTQAKSRGQQGS